MDVAEVGFGWRVYAAKELPDSDYVKIILIISLTKNPVVLVYENMRDIAM